MSRAAGVLSHLQQRLASGHIDRREAVRWALGAGLGLSAAASLLAAEGVPAAVRSTRSSKPIGRRIDWLIVGGGTAGCVLANRLSESGEARVLLLEAGGKDDWIWFHIPVGYLFAIGNPRADWMFKTEPQTHLNGRSLHYPRGKLLGGSSAINAMIYMRGQARDYDLWRDAGLPGWGWQGDGALAATCPPALTCASLPPAPALHQTGYLYLSDPERLHAMMGLLGLGDDDGEEEGVVRARARVCVYICWVSRES